MRTLIILLLMANISFAATVSITIDNTKAIEYVDYYSGNPNMTAQQKVNWLKNHILEFLRDNYKAMRIIKSRDTNVATYNTDSQTAFTE